MAYKDDQERFFQEQLELRKQRLLVRLCADSPLADPEEIREYFHFMIEQRIVKHQVSYNAAKEIVILELETAVELQLFDERFDVKET